MAHPEGSVGEVVPQQALGLTAEQIEIRRTRIGASEVPAILGLSPYDTAFSVWARKMHPDIAAPERGGHAGMGHLLEPVVASMYATKHPGCEIRRHQETVLYYDWLCATPDYTVRHPLASSGKNYLSGSGLLEIKTKRSKWLAEKDGWVEGEEEGVPVGVLAQVQIQMVVLDHAWTDIGMLPRDEDHLWEYTVPSDRAVQAEILSRLEDWYNKHIRRGQTPEHIDGPLADAFLMACFPHVLAARKVASLEAHEAMERLTVLRKEKKALEVEEERIVNSLKAECAEARSLVSPAGHTFTWFSKEGNIRYKAACEAAGVTEAELEKYRGPSTRQTRFTSKGD